MVRTTKEPRGHFIGVRLTDREYEALKILARERGDRYLSDTLRSLIPRLRLEPTGAPAEVPSAPPPTKATKRRKGA
jgi:hypothetical protein